MGSEQLRIDSCSAGGSSKPSHGAIHSKSALHGAILARPPIRSGRTDATRDLLAGEAGSRSLLELQRLLQRVEELLERRAGAGMREEHCVREERHLAQRATAEPLALLADAAQPEAGASGRARSGVTQQLE